MKKLWILTLLALLLCLTAVGCADTDHTGTESVNTSQAVSSDSTDTTNDTSDTDALPCQHTYEKNAAQEPTCETVGSESYTCTQCGHSYTHEIAVQPHDYQDATCTLPKTCRVCQATDGKALGHDYQDTRCTRCNDLRRLYSGYVFFNWYDMSTQQYVPLNADGTIDSRVIFNECFYIGDFNEYFDEDLFRYKIPEAAFLAVIRENFIFSDEQFAVLKQDFPFDSDEYDTYYKDGYFYIPGGGAGGFTPDYSHAIVGSVSRPGELTIYVEYARIDGFHYETVSYYAITYEYEGDTVFTVFGHHDYGNHIADYNPDTVNSLRVKGVTELTSLPTDMVPAIRKTLLFTTYEYYGWAGEPWESEEISLSLTVYADETKPYEIETEISCCGSFHVDGLTVTCDCGATHFTEEDLDPFFTVYREYTYGIYADALGFK